MQSPAQVPATPALIDWAALFGRMGLAVLFLWSGCDKLMYMEGNIRYMKAYAVPSPELLIWPALLVELVGGAFILVGWNARWAALALALFTIAATFIFHAFWDVSASQALNQQVLFMKNLAVLGGLLYVFAYGAGRFALKR